MSRTPIGCRDLARLAVTVERAITAKRVSASATEPVHTTSRSARREVKTTAAPAGGTGYRHEWLGCRDADEETTTVDERPDPPSILASDAEREHSIVMLRDAWWRDG